MQPKIVGMRTALAASMSYLYIAGRDGVIIDAGTGSSQLLTAADEAGATVHAVLLTHAHYDHISGLEKLCSQLPGAPVYIHASEQRFLSHPDLNLSTLFGVRVGVAAPLVPFFDCQALSFGEASFRVIHTPGHSLGSSCFFDGELLFSGDTLFHGTIGRTDHFFGDTCQEIDSIRQRILSLPGSTVIYPGHGESTRVCFEAQHNAFLRSDP